MKLRASKVHIQGIEVHVLLANKQEPQRKWLYVHTTIPTEVAVAFILLLLMQGWLCETYSHLRCGSLFMHFVSQ